MILNTRNFLEVVIISFDGNIANKYRCHSHTMGPGYNEKISI